MKSKNINQKNIKQQQKKLISANEINRFVYCPYQWYYKRHYGAKELNARYKALNREPSESESLFEKGLKHHKRHYLKYTIKRWIVFILGLALVGVCIWYLFKTT